MDSKLVLFDYLTLISYNMVNDVNFLWMSSIIKSLRTFFVMS